MLSKLRAMITTNCSRKAGAADSIQAGRAKKFLIFSCLRYCYESSLESFGRVRKFKTEDLAPLVLDTPNQQDQGALNYSLVSAELKRHARVETQVIVCAISHKDMAALEQDAHVVDRGQFANVLGSSI
ncbi:hypothetical protein BGV52_10140 [Burkholderia ubonensis]|uniref:Uncharacterized protein n=1 Tax=Burkholderia ubonensis TaxID=101571 RepID=A0A106PQ28_9BURK|nr:hypothetical protein [Burkholderia ubonensis]KWA72253.1 hypothetical protein WL29_06445 [Burkholderia ubonensis]OJB10569.1 hypothetical protein BGV52_10140 [Burkholderia ubonensis]OJB24689.1 hypothetical protein BGV54_08510 [Burkholderia ubonensis]OJB55686.1 hypothetical protein BGV61_22455 [Burkholderia ubonensis]